MVTKVGIVTKSSTPSRQNEPSYLGRISIVTPSSLILSFNLNVNPMDLLALTSSVTIGTLAGKICIPFVLMDTELTIELLSLDT